MVIQRQIATDPRAIGLVKKNKLEPATCAKKKVPVRKRVNCIGDHT
jgi:hypothetical protein